MQWNAEHNPKVYLAHYQISMMELFPKIIFSVIYFKKNSIIDRVLNTSQERVLKFCFFKLEQ